MALNLDEVRRIATLARLRFTPEQEETFTRQLGEIVAYIDQLSGFSGAVPDEAAAIVPREAADAPGACLPREVVLANAPPTEEAVEGFFVVPEVKADAGTGEGADGG